MEKKIKKLERRYFKVADLNLKVVSSRDYGTDDIMTTISGYSAIFNKWSEDLGGFKEKIAPGAFRKAIKKSDARALINHDSNKLLGRQSAGTLVLREDDNGLFMENDPPQTSYAKDLLVSMERGDIDQQSFGFTVKADQWEKDYTERTILEVDEIFDVSPVTFPAYPDTSVALRSREAAGYNPEKRETPHNNGDGETPVKKTCGDGESARDFFSKYF